jgi:hypothetical protein
MRTLFPAAFRKKRGGSEYRSCTVFFHFLFFCGGGALVQNNPYAKVAYLGQNILSLSYPYLSQLDDLSNTD